jgi:ADP-heptose:LPS heptosyltransferase
VRLIVGEADEDAARRVDLALERALPRLDRLSLRDLAARVAGCRAYLGNDSGVSHLAGLCGTRTVVMFGPTPASVWAPSGPQVLVRDFATSPAEVAAALSRN